MNAPKFENRLVGMLNQGLSQESEVALANDTPTLVIGLGGTGAEEVRYLKYLTNRMGVSPAKTQFLVIDTDARSQGGSGVFPSIPHDEYLLMDMEPTDDILNYPEAHPFISDRLGLLEDPQVLGRLREIRAKGGKQAGQVAALGLLAYLASAPQVQTVIDEKLQIAFGQFADLNGDEAVRRTPRVVVACSAAGGTGRGFFLEIAAFLRHRLGQTAIIDLHLILPNGFSRQFKNRNQKIRGDANGAAALTALDAFLDGFQADSFRFGASEAESVPVSPNIFDKVFTYERYDAKNREGGLTSLLHRIALHIAIDLKTSVGGDFDAIDTNFSAELPTDPVSGKPRRYSTNNAVSLSINPTRLRNYAVAKQILEISKNVAGSTPANADAEKEFNARHGDGLAIAKQFRAAIPMDGKSASQSLLAGGSLEGKPKHYSSKVLKQKVQLETQASGKVRSATQKRLEDLSQRHLSEATKALRAQTAEIIQASGLKSAHGTLELIKSQLQNNRRALETTIKDARQKESQTRKRLLTLVNGLGVFSTASSKTDAVLLFRQMFEHCLEIDCISATSRFFTELISFCNQFVNQFEQSSGSIDSIREEAGKVLVANTPNDRDFGDLLSELNLATPEMFDEFFQGNRLDTNRLLEELSMETEKSPAEIRIQMIDGQVFEPLVHRVVEHFSNEAAKFNVAAWLETQLKSRSELSAQLVRKINSAFENCAPSFRTRTGNAMVRFTDTIRVGVPGDVEHFPTLHRILKRAEARASHSSSVAIKIVPSDSPASLVILRRTHGACLHYLTCWNELQASYETWKREGSHPVETFGKKTLASFPEVKPERIASRQETIAALALGLGFVAKIGSRYYRNLTEAGNNGSTTFQLDLASDWDGMAFKSGQVSLSKPMATMKSQNRIHFGAARTGHDLQLVGDDLGTLDAAISRDYEFVARVERAVEYLRQTAGDHAVIAAIEQYCSQLLSNFKQGDAAWNVAQRHAHVLQQLVGQIRGAA